MWRLLVQGMKFSFLTYSRYIFRCLYRHGAFKLRGCDDGAVKIYRTRPSIHFSFLLFMVPPFPYNTPFSFSGGQTPTNSLAFLLLFNYYIDICITLFQFFFFFFFNYISYRKYLISSMTCFIILLHPKSSWHNEGMEYLM